jgi:neutral ceramidase
MSGVFQVGTTKVDITPPLTIPYLGYEPRHAFFRDVHDPLYARALVVGDGETRAVLIAADSIGYSNDILGSGRSFTHEVRLRVERLTGIPAGHVMLASSHAHSTPETIHIRRLLDTPAAQPWLEVLMDQLASAAAMAAQRQRPHTLRIGTGQVHGLSWSRRIIGQHGKLYAWSDRPPDDQVADWGAIDHQVGVLLFEGTEGDSRIVVANFACHAVTVQVQPLVSADYPGVAMALVESVMPGCQGSLFLQGACGDQNPLYGDTRDFRDVERYGLMLGGEIVAQASELGAPGHPHSVPLVAVAAEQVSFPLRDLPPRGPLLAAYEEAGRKLAAASTEAEKGRWAREQRLVQEALTLIERGTGPVVGEVQVLRLGDVALVGVPGEPFVELGLEIKRRSAAPHTLVVGYANGYIGYLATPRAWEQGGYEVSLGPWARVGPGGGPLLVEKAVALIGKLWP